MQAIAGEEMADDARRRTLEVNATGVFLVTKAVLPAIIQGQRGGRIVNVSSLAALRPRPYMAAYAASKAAVAALTQSLAQEVAQFGITVNALLPGDIDTGMKQWGYQLEAMVTQRPYDDVVAAGIARIPAGRRARRRTSPAWWPTSRPMRRRSSPASCSR
jgi:NAD(P)-dependent dehydrogenase (short-subunit alcohol dehydrogenase family)